MKENEPNVYNDQENEIREQRVTATERQKDTIEKIANKIGLDVKFEPSKDFNPPSIDVVFNGTDEDMEKFVEKVRELDEKE